MAGESKRLATMMALTAYLASEITVANGYKHTLTDAVFRGRHRVDADDPLPCLGVIESPNPDRFPNRAGNQDGMNPVQKDNWTLLMQGWVQDDKVNPTDPAYELMADAKKALAKIMAQDHESGGAKYPAIFRLGGLVLDVEYEPGTVRPPDEQSAKAFFWMRVILKFKENINDPYDLS